MKIKNLSKHAIGFLQAIGVLIYCVLVGSFMQYSSSFLPQKAGILIPVLMLVLLVFSAGITGSLVFAYPAYLVVNKRVKEATMVLAYTFTYLLLIVLLVWLVLALAVENINA